MQAFVNQGAISEAFVGQEILAYADPFEKQKLYYWQQETLRGQAEVDYMPLPQAWSTIMRSYKKRALRPLF